MMTACTMGGFGGWMWPIGMVTMVGFWALLIWGGVHQFRAWSPTSGRAESVLARRFAEGDITEDEYHARLEVLRGERSRSEWGSRL